ncbi:MAG: hypothetical protein IPK28_10760 [Devosia sp.]|nr:hypothetical protein [Devosia sp.]
MANTGTSPTTAEKPRIPTRKFRKGPPRSALLQRLHAAWSEGNDRRARHEQEQPPQRGTPDRRPDAADRVFGSLAGLGDVVGRGQYLEPDPLGRSDGRRDGNLPWRPNGQDAVDTGRRAEGQGLTVEAHVADHGGIERQHPRRRHDGAADLPPDGDGFARQAHIATDRVGTWQRDRVRHRRDVATDRSIEPHGKAGRVDVARHRGIHHDIVAGKMRVTSDWPVEVDIIAGHEDIVVHRSIHSDGLSGSVLVTTQCHPGLLSLCGRGQQAHARCRNQHNQAIHRKLLLTPRQGQMVQVWLTSPCSAATSMKTGTGTCPCHGRNCGDRKRCQKP